MEIKENDQNTYSNSYKKLMILRELNPIEQNRGQNEWNSWNPMKMINPTHFFSQKVCRIDGIWWFSTLGDLEWSDWSWSHPYRAELNWTNRTELSSTEPETNWTELDSTELKRTGPNPGQLNWNELSLTKLNWTWNELERTQLNRAETNWTGINWTERELTGTNSIESNWPGTNWNEFSATELKQTQTHSISTELERSETNTTQPNWTGTNWNDLELNGMGTNWNELNSTELKRTEPSSTQLSWNELNRTQCKWTEVNWTELNSTDLERTEPNSFQIRSNTVLSPLRWRPWAPNPNYDLHPFNITQTSHKHSQYTRINTKHKGRGFQRR